MNRPVSPLKGAEAPPAWVDGETVLNALTMAIITVNLEGRIGLVNAASEQFFGLSASNLDGRLLASLIPSDSPVFPLIRQVQHQHNAVSEYNITIETPRIGRQFVDIHATYVSEVNGCVIIAIHCRSIADKIDRQLTHRGAARSVTAMAAMLAHEVKNPLSGIRGAAQLLEQGATGDDRELTQLIREEVDRICGIVDRMGVYSDGLPLKATGVNIHKVLDRVQQLAKNGFGKHLRIMTLFDPSLPPVLGDHDQLVQVFLNLVKNAAEAAADNGGELVLETAYKQGVRFSTPGNSERIHLPLMIAVTDNGSGIANDLKRHLFDPFVSSKSNGSGLGLALVAKIVGDHGGIIECESRPNRTIFRVMLPMFVDNKKEDIA